MRNRLTKQVLCVAAGLGVWMSQTAAVGDVRENLDKYWTYRQRLKSHYVLLGLDQNYSLPAGYRIEGTTNNGYMKSRRLVHLPPDLRRAVRAESQDAP